MDRAFRCDSMGSLDTPVGTARLDDRDEPTGIRDQLAGRDYGRGFWAQQWLGLRRLFGR